MNEFDTMMADAFGEILGTMSETIWYRPGGVAEDEREIQAIVIRSRPEGIAEAPRERRPFLAIRVLADETDGISFSELDKGADTVRIARLPGLEPEVMHLAEIPDQQGAATVYLELC